MEKRQELLQNINAVFSKVYETALHDNDLRVAVDSVNKNSDDAILMELSFLDDSELGNTSLLQIYTTVCFDFNKENINEILDRLNELSIKSSVGSFGIYKKLNQIFHRYTLYIRNTDDISFIYDVSAVAQRIISVLSFLYEYIQAIASNPSQITLEEYLKNNANLITK